MDKPLMKTDTRQVLETPRLALRWLTVDDADAGFILQLVNDPDWIRYIGDKKIRTIEESRNYIDDTLLTMCRTLGFGLYLTELKENHQPIGICGLIKRDALEDVDLGFAFLPAFRGNGYAFESASAVMGHARNDFSLTRLLAITAPDNEASPRLLEKLGFRFERLARLSPEAPEVRVFATTLPA